MARWFNGRFQKITVGSVGCKKEPVVFEAKLPALMVRGYLRQTTEMQKTQRYSCPALGDVYKRQLLETIKPGLFKGNIKK